VYLFECNWWDIGSNTQGIRKEQGFTIVNTSRKWYESDPFILACQVAQVFYMNNPKLDGSWKVAHDNCQNFHILTLNLHLLIS
jgi:hypothetical protein